MHVNKLNEIVSTSRLLLIKTWTVVIKPVLIAEFHFRKGGELELREVCGCFGPPRYLCRTEYC